MNFPKKKLIENNPFLGEALKYHLKLNLDFDVRLFKNRMRMELLPLNGQKLDVGKSNISNFI